jgi:peptidyl-tRNA hydrolase, PTH1 family
LDRLTIVVGLGNPGDAYRATRHNLGFRTLDTLAARSSTRLEATGDLRSDVWWGETRLEGREVVLAKPRTYMNRSGRAAAALCRAFEAEPRDLVIVHDDADLSLGRVRVRRGGASAGHNGLRSLIDVLGTPEFVRVRLGVRGAERAESDLADYVLEPFGPHELAAAAELVEAGADAVLSFLSAGLDATMNRFNGRNVASATEPEND